MEWIKVDNNISPKFVDFLFIANDHRVAVGIFYNKKFIWCDATPCDSCDGECQPTYWMDIPELPKIIKSPKYRSIHPQLKLKVLKKYNFKCNKCGTSPALDDDVELQIDHIIPFSIGGTHDFKNLQVLCRECNYKKGNNHEKKIVNF